MAQIIPGQWFNVESAGFDQLCGITTRSLQAFERLAALNLQAFRFGLAETQEAVARTCAADSLPEMLCLPTLLAPVGAAQALSYRAGSSSRFCRLSSRISWRRRLVRSGNGMLRTAWQPGRSCL